MKEKIITAVMLKPDKKAYVTKVENELSIFQKMVGGLIDVVSLDEDIDIIVNDEGLLKQMKPNIMHPQAEDSQFLVGNCVFVSHNADGEFTSLTREQISRCLEKIEMLRYKLIKYTYELMKRKYEG